MFSRGSVCIAVHLSLSWIAPDLQAEEQEYTFKDPKGVNNISFILDSELEPIMGVANGISGTVTFDPKKPKATRGKIVVQSNTVHFQNAKMKSMLQGKEWLNVAEHPEIIFEVKKVRKVKRDSKKKNTTIMTVLGELSLNGVTREITVPLRLTHLPGQMSKRMRRSQGDLLVLRAEFAVKRSDFKVGRPMPSVAEEIQLRIAIVGSCPKSKPDKGKGGGW